MDIHKKNKLEEIEKVYQEYSRNLLDLRKQQNQVINNFIDALKQESIKELRKKFESTK